MENLYGIVYVPNFDPLQGVDLPVWKLYGIPLLYRTRADADTFSLHYLTNGIFARVVTGMDAMLMTRRLVEFFSGRRTILPRTDQDKAYFPESRATNELHITDYTCARYEDLLEQIKNSATAEANRKKTLRKTLLLARMEDEKKRVRVTIPFATRPIVGGL